MDLTYKQRLFVAAYLGEANGNATEAARIAGYAHPEVIGCRLVKKSSIRAAVSAKLNKAAMPADEVLARISQIASGSLEPFIQIEGEGRDETWRVSLTKARKAKRLGLLKKLKQGKDGPEIEIHSPLEALEKLARYHGLYDSKTDGNIDLVAIARAMGAKLRAGGDGVADPGAAAVSG